MSIGDEADLVRRLKVLSKSQSAFLKAYCHKKLFDGAEVVKETIKLLKSSGYVDNNQKIFEITKRLESLKLEEIEVYRIFSSLPPPFASLSSSPASSHFVAI